MAYTYGETTLTSLPVSFDSARQFKHFAMSQPQLSKEEERALLAKIGEGDKTARKDLILSNLYIPVLTADKMKGYRVDECDLYQEGTIGLIDAVDRFDSSRDVRFSTFASVHVKYAMMNFVFKNSAVVNISEDHDKQSSRAFYKIRSLLAEGKSVKDACDILNVSEDIGMSVLMAVNNPAHLYNEDGDPIEIEAEAGCVEDIDDQDEAMYRSKLLAGAMATLNDRHRDIIQRRLLCEHKDTLETLSVDYGVSRERIRQLESDAIGKLKKALIN